MYIPKHFDDSGGERAAKVIRKYPLATLVMQDGRGLQANHIPLYLDPEPQPLGTLQGHIARANLIWDLERETEVLAIFQGPQSYISPSWYASKAKSGKVVPTWNYIAIHVYDFGNAFTDCNDFRFQAVEAREMFVVNKHINFIRRLHREKMPRPPPHPWLHRIVGHPQT